MDAGEWKGWLIFGAFIAFLVLGAINSYMNYESTRLTPEEEAAAIRRGIAAADAEACNDWRGDVLRRKGIELCH